eukprot:3750791-Amphidinium_carterae.1
MFYFQTSHPDLNIKSMPDSMGLSWKRVHFVIGFGIIGGWLGSVFVGRKFSFCHPTSTILGVDGIPAVNATCNTGR